MSRETPAAGESRDERSTEALDCDRAQLWNKFGVQTKPQNRSSAYSVAAEDDASDNMIKADRSNITFGSYGRCVYGKAGGCCCCQDNEKGKHRGCSLYSHPGCDATVLKIALGVALFFIGVLIAALCACFIIYSVDRSPSAKELELEQRVSDLEKRFNSLPGLPRPYAQGYRGVAEGGESGGFPAASMENADGPSLSNSRPVVSESQEEPEDPTWIRRQQQGSSSAGSHDEDDDDDDDDFGQQDDNEDNDDEEELPPPLNRWKRQAPGKRQGPKPNKKNRHCKRYDKCMKAKDNGKKIPKKCKKIFGCVELRKKTALPVPSPIVQRPTPTSTPTPTPIIKVVHFTSDYWKHKGERRQAYARDSLTWIEDGMINMTEETPFRFLHEAEWMNDYYPDKSKQPIRLVGDDGGFTVTQSGLYLLYSSVMFHTVLPRHSQAVVVNGDSRFKCMDSVDYIDKDLPEGTNQAKYKSCTLTAITHLKQGDRLELQNLYANTMVDLSPDATFFGAALLTPGEPTTKH